MSCRSSSRSPSFHLSWAELAEIVFLYLFIQTGRSVSKLASQAECWRLLSLQKWLQQGKATIPRHTSIFLYQSLVKAYTKLYVLSKVADGVTAALQLRQQQQASLLVVARAQS
jgi:hypothetical protein